MASIGSDDTLKSQTIAIDLGTAINYPNTLPTPAVYVFLMGFKYETTGQRLLIRLSTANVRKERMDVVVTTNGLVALK
jgi:hypothetical protein